MKRINFFFNRISHDLRLFNLKFALIISVFTLFLGIFSWIIGGRADKIMLLYIFPRGALSLGIMYFLWAINFIFFGITICGIACGCEKYKKREAIKAVTFLLLSFLCVLCVYPLFFKSLAPFITFIVLILSSVFMFLALISSFKIYSLWTICILINLLWLLYNTYISIIIALIN